jgi:hypothetical protein
MNDPPEFHTHMIEAPATPAPNDRLTVAGTGGNMDFPAVAQRIQQPPPVRHIPEVTQRASDGSPALHMLEAAIAQGPVDDAPSGHGQGDLLTSPIWVEHRCGHLVQVKVWKDVARRNKQIERIGKQGICYSCATGKK